MTYEICAKCVMDTSDVCITFNDEGICNYCIDFENKISLYRFTKAQEEKNLIDLKSRILNNKIDKYDSLIGLSGGVDSSYLALLAKKMELNPLCVHFDNGWNSDTALGNIQKIIKNTGFDLETYVIDWIEFKDLQRSFIKAGVVDIEMLTDHAIFASLFKIRKKNKIKTVLSGTNFVTEQNMPKYWSWNKMDSRNIKDIHKKYGSVKLKTFPFMNTFRWQLMKKFRLGGIFEEPLNVINYSKIKAIEELKKTFDWNYYGEKHYESVFTKFYQAYVLPYKFQIDKRKVHYSDLLRNNEITRDDAISKINTPLYSNEDAFRTEKNYVLKKLGFSEVEFNSYMDQNPVLHSSYKTDKYFIDTLKYVFNKFLEK